jgi:hypothetical protein
VNLRAHRASTILPVNDGRPGARVLSAAAIWRADATNRPWAHSPDGCKDD